MGLTPGGDVVLITSTRLMRVSAGGKPLWDVDFQEGHSCGYPSGLAIGFDDAIVVACGYSLLRFSGAGSFVWQKWPLGSHRLSQPWVDRQGVAITSGDGKLAAVDAAGDPLWIVELGFNRNVWPIGLSPDQHFVFRTSMAARHSSAPNGPRVYYVRVPPELLTVGRDGKVLERVPVDEESPQWPAALPVSRNGAHRLPW
jgi:hypothetical protein